jgi:hypothetical protein
LTSRRGTAVVCVLSCLLAAAIALSASTVGDYSVNGPVAGDNAAPAINALLHLHLGRVVALQPLMGLTSILLRAPAAALAHLTGAGNLWTLRAGALLCLLPAGMLVAWMIRQAEGRREICFAVIAGVVVLAGPATGTSVGIGHPEEVLASVLATGAVLAAIGAAAGWSALLLGLAVGCKPWALLAVVPVTMALPDRRLITLLRAGALAAVLSLTLPLADPGAYVHSAREVGRYHFTDLLSWWWSVSPRFPMPPHATVAPLVRLLPFGLTRSSAMSSGLLLIVAALALLALRARKQGQPIDALAMLALLGLARCVIDPLPLEYNFVALLFPLAAWEVVVLRRAPAALMSATFALMMISGGGLAIGSANTYLIGSLSPRGLNTLSLAWTAALAAYLAGQVFRRASRVERPPLRVSPAGALTAGSH